MTGSIPCGFAGLIQMEHVLSLLFVLKDKIELYTVHNPSFTMSTQSEIDVDIFMYILMLFL